MLTGHALPCLPELHVTAHLAVAHFSLQGHGADAGLCWQGSLCAAVAHVCLHELVANTRGYCSKSSHCTALFRLSTIVK
jgi:hypothetical protein